MNVDGNNSETTKTTMSMLTEPSSETRVKKKDIMLLTVPKTSGEENLGKNCFIMQ